MSKLEKTSNQELNQALGGGKLPGGRKSYDIRCNKCNQFLGKETMNYKILNIYLNQHIGTGPSTCPHCKKHHRDYEIVEV